MSSLTGKTISAFESLRTEFKCEIALFRKIPGTLEFQIVKDSHGLELGEEVELRSRVRPDDGEFKLQFHLL